MDKQPAKPRRIRLVDFVLLSAISVVLLAMLLVALLRARETSQVAGCRENLRRIGAAIRGYADVHRDKLPPLLDYDPRTVSWSPFWFSLYPHLGQQSLFDKVLGSEAAWAKGNHAAVVDVLLCPSDTSHQNGLCTSGAKGWAGTSYSPNYSAFGLVAVYNPDVGAFITQAKYTLSGSRFADPMGTAASVAVVERFASIPAYGCSNAALYPMSHAYWGWQPYGSIYGLWGGQLPQVRASATGSTPAHPYHPSTAHKTCQVLFLDGAVRPFTAFIGQATWNTLVVPYVPIEEIGNY